MKRKLHILPLALIGWLLSIPAAAIQFYRSGAQGEIARINPAAFEECRNVAYRISAKEELSGHHRRTLLERLIRGETINDLAAVITHLQRNPDACTYGDDNEIFPIAKEPGGAAR